MTGDRVHLVLGERYLKTSLQKPLKKGLCPLDRRRDKGNFLLQLHMTIYEVPLHLLLLLFLLMLLLLMAISWKPSLVPGRDSPARAVMVKHVLSAIHGRLGMRSYYFL